MIIEVSGDILLTNAQVIAHGIAPNDDFSAVNPHLLDGVLISGYS